MRDVWPIVHAERTALIRDLAELDDTAETTRRRFIAGMVRARFDFDRHNERGLRRARGTSPQATLQRLREVAHRTSTPPAPLDSRIVEEVVHGEDIRRPLGMSRAYLPEAVRRALHHQVRIPAASGGAKGFAAGIQLAATDNDLTIGDGPQVVGPALSLLLAASGRRVALDDLEGPGLAVVAEAIG